LVLRKAAFSFIEKENISRCGFQFVLLNPYQKAKNENCYIAC
jgi:hypothetical protein